MISNREYNSMRIKGETMKTNKMPVQEDANADADEATVKVNDLFESFIGGQIKFNGKNIRVTGRHG